MTASEATVHATCVAIDGQAVLIEGKSGAGKSDLALRLIDRGAVLVSDDYTRVSAVAGGLIASAPPDLAGKIEVRGIGILPIAHVDDVPVSLLVTISEQPERMPQEPRSRAIVGIEVREIALPSLEPSSALKVELALRHLTTFQT